MPRRSTPALPLAPPGSTSSGGRRRLASGGWTRRPGGLCVPRSASADLPGRRIVVRSLGTFAAMMMARAISGCDDRAARGGTSGTGGGPGGGRTPAALGTGGSGGGEPGDPFPPHDVPGAEALVSLIAQIGELGDPDANGVRLADGFSSRILATSDQKVSGTDHVWHLAPDGGATFRTEDGGWIYTSNSELPLVGGVSALRFDEGGEIVDAYTILDRTSGNCAGGPTPWNTWLSCEEIAKGRVHECDPWGEQPPVARPAMGVFKHEAVTVDPDRGQLYLTEDEEDGRFYRFTPDGKTASGRLDLASGLLEVMVASDDGDVTWVPVPDPLFENGTATREQVPESKLFSGGEGVWYFRGVVYFSTKGTNQVWALDVAEAKLTVLYDDDDDDEPILSGVDNITVSASGDVLVAEDGGDLQICAILPDGTVKPLIQLVGHDESEITGPAFDPSGTRLYFSSQRGRLGERGVGVTFEVTGPFHEPA